MYMIKFFVIYSAVVILYYVQIIEGFKPQREISLNYRNKGIHVLRIDDGIAQQNNVQFSRGSISNMAVSNVIGCSLLIPAGYAALYHTGDHLDGYIYLLSSFFFTLTGILDLKATSSLAAKNDLDSIMVIHARLGSWSAVVTGLTFGIGTIYTLTDDLKLGELWYHACYGSIIVNMYILLSTLTIDYRMAKVGYGTSPSGKVYQTHDCNAATLPVSFCKDIEASFWLRLYTITLNLLGTGCFAASVVTHPALLCTIGGVFFTLGSIAGMAVEVHHPPGVDYDRVLVIADRVLPADAPAMRKQIQQSSASASD